MSVGVHWGEVLLARLGGERRCIFSLAGDTVNLPSSLMEVAKQQGASLAVSSTVAEAVQGTPVKTGLCGLQSSPSHPIRGCRATVDIWLDPAVGGG